MKKRKPKKPSNWGNWYSRNGGRYDKTTDENGNSTLNIITNQLHEIAFGK